LLFVGIMSGTSLDGIDAALVEFSGSQALLKGTHFIPYDQSLKEILLALNHPAGNELHQAQLTANELARLYAATTLALLKKHNLKPNQIRAIGCHGQTIRHCPELGYTLQLGNSALLAELTGISVISDFRSRDIAAGGQGAPLVSAFHDKILRHPSIHRVIVNIGGISNLTDLPPVFATTGFDCGPGNLLMDAWCMQHLGEPYDNGGAWAATGTIQPLLLEQMLNEAYFAQLPPKSCGRELFNTAWLHDLLRGDEKPQDVQATLLELTAFTITQSIQQHCIGTKEVYLCGGGARNQTLLNRIAILLPDSTVRSTNFLGVDSNYLEAIAFAWLARQTVHGEAANLPAVTGAQHSCVLGAVYPA